MAGAGMKARGTGREKGAGEEACRGARDPSHVNVLLIEYTPICHLPLSTFFIPFLLPKETTMPVSVLGTVYSTTVHRTVSKYCVVMYTLLFAYFPLFLLDYKSVFFPPVPTVGSPIVWMNSEKKM